MRKKRRTASEVAKRYRDEEHREIEAFTRALQLGVKALIPIRSFDTRRRLLKYMCDQFGIDPVKL